MVCTAAIIVALHTTPARILATKPAVHQRVCLPKRYAKALAKGHFVVLVDGKAVAISNGKVAR